MSTAVLAIGSRSLAKCNVIVTRLSAIEELAGIDILCSDKTGTLTLNQLTTGKTICFEQFSDDEVLLAAVMCSKAI